MGKFGWQISRNDDVLDFVQELKERSFNLLLKEYSSVFSNVDADNIDTSIFIVAVVAEHIKPNSLSMIYYGGGDTEQALRSASGLSISQGSIKEVKKGLQSICKYLQAVKENFSNKEITIGDNQGNKLSFPNAYEFYMAVVGELVNVFKSVKVSSTDSSPARKGSEYTVDFSNYYKTEESPALLNKVPSIDKAMLNAGLKDVLHFQNEGCYDCYYLAERVSTLTNDVKNLLVSEFKKKQPGYCEDADYDLDELACYDCVEFIIGESSDKKSIKITSMTGDDTTIPKESFWRDDFHVSNPIINELKGIVSNIVDTWERRNIVVDRIILTVKASYITDIDKASKVLSFVGVSRMYENAWDAQEDPEPIVEDTYEVIYALVIPEEENTRIAEA